MQCFGNNRNNANAGEKMRTVEVETNKQQKDDDYFMCSRKSLTHNGKC